MSFELRIRDVLYERWREVLRFAQNDSSGRAQNNIAAVETRQFATAETRNPKPETFFDTEFLKKL